MILLWLVNTHELFYLIVAILVLVLLLIISVMLYGYGRYKAVGDKRVGLDIIHDELARAIADAAPSGSILLREHMTRASFRHLFADALVSSAAKFSGASFIRIQNLFHAYQLREDAFAKLKSAKPYIVGKGIQELRAMQVKEALPDIEGLLEHKSPDVYLEAQYALTSFKGFEGLQFLRQLQYPLSEWQQIRILSAIPVLPEVHTAFLEDCLNSEQDSVVVLTLRLIRKFQLLSFRERVLVKIQHPSIAVRIHAVKCLERLGIAGVDRSLLESFPKQPLPVQYEIVKTLKKNRNKDYRDFFFEQLSQHENSAIRLGSAEALLALNCGDILHAILEDKAADAELKRILRHAFHH